MEYGYVRVSTKEQNPDRQIEKMLRIGLQERNIFIEKQSGKDMMRPLYQSVKSSLANGDVLYLDSIDRLGRNYEAVKSEWYELTRGKGVDVVALDLPDLFDSRKFRAQGDVGKLLEDQMLSLLAWVADQERKKIKSRQKEGIAIAKAQGKYKGRQPKKIDVSLFTELVKAWEAGKMALRDVCAELGVSTATFYRRVKEYRCN